MQEEIGKIQNKRYTPGNISPRKIGGGIDNTNYMNNTISKFIKSTLINTLLVFISIIIALMLLEGGMRFFDIQAEELMMSRIMALDPHCGFRLRPNRKLSGIPGLSSPVQINSLGMRDKEYSRKKPSNTTRILALGDSFTYGVVHYDYNFLTLLEKQLNKRFQNHNIEILNSGVPGYQPVNYLAYLKEYGVDFQPDGVLLFFYVGNDLRENQRSPNDIHPELPISKDQKNYEQLPLYNYFHHFRLYWALLNAIQKTRTLLDIHQRMPDIDEKTLKNPKHIVPDFSFMSKEQYDKVLLEQARLYLKPEYRIEWDTNNFKQTAKIIQQIQSLCHQKNILFAVIFLPSEIQVEPNLQKQLAELSTDFLIEAFDFQEPQKTLAALLKEKQIHSMNLLPYFSEHSQEKTLYLLRDTHWNETGNQLAADVLQDPVYHWIQEGLLASKKD